MFFYFECIWQTSWQPFVAAPKWNRETSCNAESRLQQQWWHSVLGFAMCRWSPQQTMYCATKLLTTLNPGWQLWLSFDGIKLLPQTAGSIQYQKGEALLNVGMSKFDISLVIYTFAFGRHDISEDFPWLNDWMTIWLLLGNAQKRIHSFTKAIFWDWTFQGCTTGSSYYQSHCWPLPTSLHIERRAN